MPALMPLIEDKRPKTAKDDAPGCGCLIVTRQGRRFTLPLKAVSFSAIVAERVAEVTVEQTFENSYAELLEAVYIFPLSGGAAVSRFELHVDGKKLVGIVEERGEARRQYDQAIAQGKKAALLEQERDDVFTVKVGNLPPRSVATIKMVYSERLPAFDDGETELRFPLVVAPRYIPGQPLERASLGDGTEADTQAVPDASRISPPRLAPGLRGDVKLGIQVEIMSQDAIDELGCTQHATKVSQQGGRLLVALGKQDELLDRDFVLRWKTAANEERPVLLVTKKNGECYGLLSIVPPRDVPAGQGARDVVFLLDRSGSMAGAKMDSAKRACARLLDTLQPQDRFALCAFSNGADWMETSFVAADRRGKARGADWIRRLPAAGGTELDPALEGVFALFENESGVVAPGKMQKLSAVSPRLPVLVIVTDGEVGNESDILRRVEGRLSNIRVHTLGIDTAVNAAFLRRLAHLGRGTATLCAPGPTLEDALSRIGKEIGTPVLLDIEVEDRGLGFDPASITPERLPDLFAGRTASIFFTCRSLEGGVKIRAQRAGGGVFEETVKAEAVELNALPQLWAKSRVQDLEDRYRLAYGGAGGGLEAARFEILALALEHQLLTKFTAFIVIDHSEVAERMAKRKIVQAVETPLGWDEAEQGEVHARLGTSIAPGAAPSASRPPAPSMDVFALDLDYDAEPVAGSISASEESAKGMGSGDDLFIEPFDDGPGDPFGAPPAAAPAPRARSKATPPPPPASGRAPMPAKEGKSESRDQLSRLSAKRGRGSGAGDSARKSLGEPSPSRSLATVLDELGKELTAILSALEAGQWPTDGGQKLKQLRAEALVRLDGLAKKALRTSELLSTTLTSLLALLQQQKAKPQDVAHSVRAASEALAAQCRAELAPLLGAGGSPWEATI